MAGTCALFPHMFYSNAAEISAGRILQVYAQNKGRDGKDIEEHTATCSFHVEHRLKADGASLLLINST